MVTYIGKIIHFNCSHMLVSTMTYLVPSSSVHITTDNTASFVQLADQSAHNLPAKLLDITAWSSHSIPITMLPTYCTTPTSLTPSSKIIGYDGRALPSFCLLSTLTIHLGPPTPFASLSWIHCTVPTSLIPSSKIIGSAGKAPLSLCTF